MPSIGLTTDPSAPKPGGEEGRKWVWVAAAESSDPCCDWACTLRAPSSLLLIILPLMEVPELWDFMLFVALNCGCGSAAGRCENCRNAVP